MCGRASSPVEQSTIKCSTKPAVLQSQAGKALHVWALLPNNAPTSLQFIPDVNIVEII